MIDELGYRLHPSNWWLRSPNVSNSNNSRLVNTDGSLNNNNAYNSTGVVPDCVHSQLKVRPIGSKSVQECKEPISCPLLGGEKYTPMPLIQDLIEWGYPRRDYFTFNETCLMCVMGEILDFKNLHRAMLECAKGVRWKDSVARYVNNGLMSVYKLRQDLLKGVYRVSQPIRFIIYEPKRREVTSTKFRDRIVDKSLNKNYYAKAISRHFIYDNGACQVDKGTDFSRSRLRAMLAKYYRKHGNDGYVLVLDIKGFFGNTTHSTAKRSVADILGCPCGMFMVANVVDSYATDDNPDTGIGLGSEINQYTQLAVLSKIDHHIKEKLQCRYYQRYMDDMVIVHHSKEHLRVCRDEIAVLLNGIELELNQSKTQIKKLSEGINYLGFRFRVTITGKVLMTVKKSNIKKRKRKILAHAKLVNKGEMDKDRADMSFQSWLSHIDKGNNYKLNRSMIQYYTDAMGGIHGSSA